MSDTATVIEPPAKTSKLPLLIAIVVALFLGGGGFYATYSGMFLNKNSHTVHDDPDELPDISFVKIDPIILGIGDKHNLRYLRFGAHLETPQKYMEDVEKLVPRIVDVLNGYLRAIEVHELEDSTTLVRLKAQMLRRIQIATGEGRVRDLLISEFVLN